MNSSTHQSNYPSSIPQAVTPTYLHAASCWGFTYAWVEIRCYSVSGDAHITQAYGEGPSSPARVGHRRATYRAREPHDTIRIQQSIGSCSTPSVLPCPAATRPAKRHSPLRVALHSAGQPVDPTSWTCCTLLRLVVAPVCAGPPSWEPRISLPIQQLPGGQALSKAAIPQQHALTPLCCTRSLHAEAYVQLAARIIILIELCTPPEPAPDLDRTDWHFPSTSPN